MLATIPSSAKTINAVYENSQNEGGENVNVKFVSVDTRILFSIR